MSPCVADAQVDSGRPSSRIAWVQLATGIKGVDVIVVAPYIPHFGRINPALDDTYQELEELFTEFDRDPRKRRAIKVVLGDFNGRLARAYNFTGRRRGEVSEDQKAVEVTGCWSVHHSDNEMGAKLRGFLQDRSLVSAATYFKPRQKVAGASTYVPFGRNAARKCDEPTFSGSL